MKERSIVITSATGLVVGCILGIAGSVIPSATFRVIVWAIGSTALILASALLTIYYFRKGQDAVAAGFLLYAIAETVVFSSCGIDLNVNIASFGSGSFLWALSISVLSLHKAFPFFVRCTGMISATSFAIVALLIFTGHPVNALARPLPFFAYPFLAATLMGWAWTLVSRYPHSLKV